MALALDELEDGTTLWSLESDIKLLECLKMFSNDIITKTNNLSKIIDQLNFETIKSSVTLRSTVNEFLMLADSQFIENVSLLLNLRCLS